MELTDKNQTFEDVIVLMKTAVATVSGQPTAISTAWRLGSYERGKTILAQPTAFTFTADTNLGQDEINKRHHTFSITLILSKSRVSGNCEETRYTQAMPDKRVNKHIDWHTYGRIIIFIDAANVIYSLRDLGWKIDYKKFQQYFKKRSTLIDIYFYTAFFDDDIGRKNMLEMLSRKGFKIRSKAVKHIKTQDGSVLHKANCDVELTMDVMTLHPQLDTAILMSGDSDFVPLVKLLQSHGKKVVIISTRGHVARELIEASDYFVYFDFFRKDWEMKTKSKSPRKADSR